MPSKKVILAIVAIALLFGVVVSGCNRNRDTRTAQSGTKRQAKSAKKNKENRRERELAMAPAVRPAEVLAASVKRPQQQRRGPARPMNRQPQPVYNQSYQQQPMPAIVTTSYELAKVHEPLPEPIPVAQLYAQSQPVVYTQPSYSQPVYQAQTYAAPTYDVYSSPSVYSAPEPIQVIHPSPELAMARASLEPVPMPTSVFVPQSQPANVVPLIEPQMFRAPIPELEPVRYQRVAAQQPQQSPVLMSGSVPAWSAPAQPEMRSAVYEPLPQQTSTSIQGWVPSPATAMGGMRGGY